MRPPPPVRWSEVQAEEDALLEGRRSPAAYRTGLALSGGGVRSASFSLGVLQVLAEARLLRHFDYLSTVSGGGYIGSALALRLAEAARADKMADVDSLFPYGEPDGDSPALAHIRRHGNYLAPSGFGSLATGFYIVARSILLNLFIWITLGAALLATLMFATDWVGGVGSAPGQPPATPWTWPWSDPEQGALFFWLMLGVASLLALLLALAVVGVSLSSWWVRSDPKEARRKAPGDGEGKERLWAWGVAGVSGLALLGALDLPPFGWTFSWPTGGDAVQATLPALALLAVLVPALTQQVHRRATHGQTDMSVKYARRRLQERFAGFLLPVALFFAAIGAIPFISEWVMENGPDAARVAAEATATDATGATADAARGGVGSLPLFLMSLGSAGATLYGFYQGHIRGKLGAGSSVVVIAGSILLVFAAALVAHQIAANLIRSGAFWTWFGEDNPALQGAAALPAIAVQIAFALAIFVNVNDMSLSRFYRDRLMEAFMPDLDAGGKPAEGPATRADRFLMSAMTTRPDGADAPLIGPYLLVNTYLLARRYRGDRKDDRKAGQKAAQKADRAALVARIRRRRGDSFVLTPRRVGSTLTGWRATRDVLDNQLTVPTAMAISGAAVNPGSGIAGQGPTANAATAIAMSLLSLRLGYRFRWNGGGWLGGFGRWMNPFGNHFVPGLSEILAETFSRPSTEDPTFIELSDGGHFDNLGIYELIRRRCGLILVCDGGEDSTGSYESFTSLMTLAREDFGAVFRLDCALAGKPSGPAQLVARPRSDEYPKAAEFAERGFFLATIHYDDAKPKRESVPKGGPVGSGDAPKDAPDGEGLLEDRTTDGPAVGLVIYLKATMLAELGLPSRGYKGVNPAFPSEPTTDQFFSPEQFNAYVDVGNRVARQMLEATELRRRLGKDPARRPDLGALLAAFAPPDAGE